MPIYQPAEDSYLMSRILKEKIPDFLKENSMKMNNSSIMLFCKEYEKENGEVLKQPTLWGWINGVGNAPPVVNVSLIMAESPKKSTPTPRYSLIAPGTVLTREYDGEEHVVEALESGFKYRGNNYTSISAVTRHITNRKQRNGFDFFRKSISNMPAKYTQLSSDKVESTLPNTQVIFCSNCHYHAEAELEEEDICKASLARTPSGNISFVRRPSTTSGKKVRCQRINVDGGCDMFQTKMKKDD